MPVYYCACCHVGLAHSPPFSSLFGVDWGGARVAWEGVARGSGAVALPLLSLGDREHGHRQSCSNDEELLGAVARELGAYHRELGETPTCLHDWSTCI